MSKFICLDCWRVFDEDEIATWEEPRGEYWGMPCWEWVNGCPYCHGYYEKTYQCDICEEWISGEYIKLKNDKRICENCYMTYELGEERW